jgi:hypothetical protein
MTLAHWRGNSHLQGPDGGLILHTRPQLMAAISRAASTYAVVQSAVYVYTASSVSALSHHSNFASMNYKILIIVLGVALCKSVELLRCGLRALPPFRSGIKSSARSALETISLALRLHTKTHKRGKDDELKNAYEVYTS